MNQKLYSTLIVIAFLALCVNNSLAQNGLEGRTNIKASHSYFNYVGFQKIHYFQIEYNRGITKFLEVGTYLSTHSDYYLVTRINPFNNEPYTAGLENRAFHYGFQTNIHPLQLLLSEGHRFRLDLYINAKLGGRYSPVPNDALRQRENFFEYDIGAGLAYHLYKHWGVYVEYNYRSPANFRYGLSIKF